MADLEAVRVRLDGKWRVDELNDCPILLRHRAHGFNQILEHFHRIEARWRNIDAPCFDLGQVQNLVDQAEQMLCGGAVRNAKGEMT